jgi:menaquinol-cytochrome c reductase iron-sulfur subunit
MNRKTFLKVFVNGTGLVIGGTVAVPALLTGFSPVWNRRHGELWQQVGKLDEFPIDDVRKAVFSVPRDDLSRSLREKSVYVWRSSDKDVVVYSRNCTDLSCPITWDAGSGWFYCPCHGGIFAKNGDRKAGPPKRPLYRFANRVRDGLIEIDLNSLPPMT